MRAPVRALTALCLSVCAVSGQTGPADASQVRALLNSGRLADKAWGAYYARQIDDPDLREPLIEALRQAKPYRDSQWFSEKSMVVAALLDALIGIGGDVPLDAILPFDTPEWRDAILVLLSRQQGAEAALLTMRNDSPLNHYDWLAINNLLFTMRSKPFFIQLLKETEITHTFIVRDGPLPNPGGGSAGSLTTSAEPNPPAGFPPVGFYTALERPGEQGGVLADGPVTIWYARAQRPLRQGPEQDTAGLDRHRLEYLGAWNGQGSAYTTGVFSPTTILEWAGAAAFKRKVDASLDDQVAAIRAYAKLAGSHGAPSLSGIQLRIVPIVKDMRLKSGALPAIAPRDIAIK
jgi:hypothetical protein